MIHYNRRFIALAICLAALAGYVDALGFISMGGVFVSFMSGNSTQLAVAAAQGQMMPMFLRAGIIILFVAGVVGGSLLGRRARDNRPTAVLMLVTTLLILATLCFRGGHESIAIIIVALAMGAENNVFERDGEVSIGLTYMTGTLVKMGQRIANACCGGPRWAWVPYFLLWAGLVLGALAGSLSYARIGLNSLGFAAGAAFCLMMLAKRWGQP